MTPTSQNQEKKEVGRMLTKRMEERNFTPDFLIELSDLANPKRPIHAKDVENVLSGDIDLPTSGTVIVRILPFLIDPEENFNDLAIRLLGKAQIIDKEEIH